MTPSIHITGYTVLCLLTYETVHANGILLEINRDDHITIKSRLIDRYFGRNYNDNKVTVVLLKDNKLTFITFWDQSITIGNTAHIINDFCPTVNNYRVVLPIKDREIYKDIQIFITKLMGYWKNYNK